MITFNQIAMTYGQKLLFYNVDLVLNNYKRYALVGANGCGKSTLFKLIANQEESGEGEIVIPKDISIGWLKQDQFRYENTPIRKVVLEGKQILFKALEEKEELLNHTAWDDLMGFRLGELEEIISHHDGYTASSTVENILLGLGISEKYFDEPLKSLSGGYKLRVLLGQTLFQNPDILLLDEPTNHLDMPSIQWLETFLKQYQGLVLFISHDVTFINHLADFILDVDYGEIRSYRGNYQRFLTEKSLVVQQKMLERQGLEAKIAAMEKFITRFGAKASKASQARSRVKMIEKIELPDIEHSSRKAPIFNFNLKKPSSKQVLKAQELTKNFAAKRLFQNLNFQVIRGDKLAVMGANGMGKSSLIKIIMNQLDCDAGDLIWGENVRVSYLSQDHHELLNYSTTVLQWLGDKVTEVPEQQIRKTLSQMLFIKDDVNKNILSLSGGEAARLLMAKIILECPNLIVLDEPTNHMDLETIEALGEALSAYSGSVVLVSHDRSFINQVANKIMYFDINGIYHHQGTYAEFSQERKKLGN